jgi:hypothetical protein
VPILIVGTKQDLVSAVRDGHRGNGMDEAGAETVNVNCMNRMQFNSGSTEEFKMKCFFEKVIEKRYYPRGETPQVCLV